MGLLANLVDPGGGSALIMGFGGDGGNYEINLHSSERTSRISSARKPEYEYLIPGFNYQSKKVRSPTTHTHGEILNRNERTILHEEFVSAYMGVKWE